MYNMEKISIKRNCRSETILDHDDLLFLSGISGYSSKANPLYYGILRENLNMSNKSFLVHEKRLLNYGLIITFNPLKQKDRFKGKKIKYVYITTKGKEILEKIRQITAYKYPRTLSEEFRVIEESRIKDNVKNGLER